MRTLLTIAGFDPSSGAGITADVMVFAAHGFFGTSAITALTVQSTRGVRATEPIDADLLAKTLGYLWDDLPAAGIKIGMLGSEDAVNVVADFLQGVRNSGWCGPVVLDPVLRASSGRELLSLGAATRLRDRLLPEVGWITPNLEEAARLLGRPSVGRADLLRAALELRELSEGLSVLITGGHLDSPDDLLLARGMEEPVWLPGERLETRATHGTGCALSSALLCRLADHEQPLAAARGAKQYVAQAMRSASPVGHGHGPIAHLWTRPLQDG